MSSVYARSLIWLLTAGVAVAQQPAGLELRVLEGAGMVVPRGGQSSRRIAVEVREAGGGPVRGATVTFRLPAEGPTGRFPSGLQWETLLTGEDGRAAVYGLQWGNLPGELAIVITATHAGRRATVQVPVEISVTAPAERVHRAAAGPGGGGGAAKWLILAGIAGGALAGLSMAGRGKTGPAPAAITAPAAPVIGAPAISIGKP